MRVGGGGGLECIPKITSKDLPTKKLEYFSPKRNGLSASVYKKKKKKRKIQ